MKKKVSFIFLMMFAVQVIASCCENKTYELTITGMESRALVFDGNNLITYDFNSSIDKEDLVLEASFSGVEERIASRFEYEFSKLGFQSAYASIDCEDQTIVFKNKVVGITVSILDTNNNNMRIDITNQVIVYGTQQSIADYIANTSLSIYDELLIQIADTSNIPGRIEYDIEATLDDGSVVSSAGGIINFN